MKSIASRHRATLLSTKLSARGRDTYPHTFRAVLSRERYVASELERVADQVCDGSLTPLLLSLAGRAKLSPEERRRIQQLLGGEPNDPTSDEPAP